MNWEKLLFSTRRKPKKASSSSSAMGRAEIERDFDRVLFLAPTRRLADKTQVFPLEQNDSVRTRLTHSYEVSNLARSIGVQLVFENKNKIFDGEISNCCLEREIPALLATIGLAHDLGNPPFGHQGEKAIQDWFKKNIHTFVGKEINNPEGTVEEETNELSLVEFQNFLKFDGNAQTLRLLTKLQILNDSYGINLTYATLAAMIKYPQSSKYIRDLENDNLIPTWKKSGYFASEAEIIKDIWDKTGLSEGIRHPLTYIMEACDDIAYSVLDAEDIVKKGLASFYDLVNHLECHSDDCSVVNELISKIRKDNVKFRSEDLSPAELNDVSMQKFRVFAIGELQSSIIQAFIENKDKFMDITSPAKDLMSLCSANKLCEILKDFDKKWGYQNKSVLKLELRGHNYIQELMDMLWVGIHGQLSDEYLSTTPFGKYAYQKVSENYRRIFENKANKMPILYKEAQLLTDAISGMTDNYLILLHTELKALYKKE